MTAVKNDLLTTKVSGKRLFVLYIDFRAAQASVNQCFVDFFDVPRIGLLSPRRRDRCEAFPNEAWNMLKCNANGDAS